MSEEAKANIEKMKVAIEQMKAAGEDLFKDEIATLQEKIDTAEKEAAAEAEKVVEQVKEVEQNFVQKYGAGAARAVEIVLLATILYKLF